MKFLRVFFLFSFFSVISWTTYSPESLYQNLSAHINYLASNELKGRFPLTQGDFLAREYIISTFKNIGLSDITHHHFQQEFDYLHKIEPHCQFQIATKTQTSLLKRGTDYTILHTSGNGSFTHAKAVLIGYSNKIDTSKIKNIIKGKVVLAYSFPPKSIDKKIRKEYDWRNVIKLSEKYGAKAVLFVAPGKKYEKFKLLEKKYPYSQRIKRYKIPLLNISRKIYERILTSNNLKLSHVENEIKQKEGKYWKCLTQTDFNLFINSKFVYGKAANLIGALESTSPKNNDFILIGAHYDHLLPKKRNGCQDSIRNGADDNASGVALLLEIARSLSTMKERKINFLFVCFGAEEGGMIGSKFFVKNPPINLQNLKLMINLDMVGRMRQNKLYIKDYNMKNEYSGRFFRLSAKNGIELSENRSGGTDSDTFWRKNIPAIWISTGPHNDQHMVTDEIDKINFHGLIKIHHLILEFLNSLPENIN